MGLASGRYHSQLFLDKVPSFVEFHLLKDRKLRPGNDGHLTLFGKAGCPAQ